MDTANNMCRVEYRLSPKGEWGWTPSCAIASSSITDNDTISIDSVTSDRFNEAFDM